MGTRTRREAVLGERKLTRQEVALRAGVPLERATTLWRAMGFQTVGDSVVEFTDADLEALVVLEELVERGALDSEAVVSMVRNVSSQLSRLAEWQATDLLTHAEDEEDIAEVVPALEGLVTYVWRRHLAAALEHHHERREVMTIGFVDIVGYTSLVRDLGPEDVDALVDRFEALALEVTTRHGGKVVKSIGDAVLVSFDEPAPALQAALELAGACHEDDLLPDVRTGLAYGPVLTRYGDVYGSTVNLASRLTDMARPGSVLVEEDLAEQAGEGVTFKVVRRRSVPDYPHLRALVATRTTERDRRKRIPFVPPVVEDFPPVYGAVSAGQEVARFLGDQVLPRAWTR